MTDPDMLTKALDGLVAAGPVAAVLGIAVAVLWRRLRERETQVEALLREVLTALAGNTAAQVRHAEAVEGLRDAIESGGAGRHRRGAD